MAEATFDPTNELERVLVNVTNGRATFEEFLKMLMTSEVHVLSGAEVQADGTGFQPLLFDREQGTLMAVFTARERGTLFGDNAPFCLTMTGRQLIERVPSELGIVLNPGFKVGFELPAQGVQDIRRDFTEVK